MLKKRENKKKKFQASKYSSIRSKFTERERERIRIEIRKWTVYFDESENEASDPLIAARSARVKVIYAVVNLLFIDSVWSKFSELGGDRKRIVVDND